MGVGEVALLTVARVCAQADAGEAGFMVHSGCSVYDEHLGLCMEAGEGDMVRSE